MRREQETPKPNALETAVTTPAAPVPGRPAFRSRWSDWRPEEATMPPASEPAKPAKPGFEGFAGTDPGPRRTSSRTRRVLPRAVESPYVCIRCERSVPETELFCAACWESRQNVKNVVRFRPGRPIRTGGEPDNAL